jgi:putative nucleotidyltransferase with HDIG domain
VATSSVGRLRTPAQEQRDRQRALDHAVVIASGLLGVDGAAVLVADDDAPGDSLRVVAVAGAAESHRGRVVAKDALAQLGAAVHRPISGADADGEPGTLVLFGKDAAVSGLDAPDGTSALDDLVALATLGLRGAAGQSTVTQILGAGVRALASLLDLRDGYTGGHADGVVALCERIGEQMGLEPRAMNELTIAARLHDLGKIGVPDVILHKPGRLTASEWKIMRQHPEWGACALEGVPGTEAAAAAIRGHHERWDGRGYPDGLAGEAIPIASRIIAVADSWHAMTSNRSYRRALDADHAREVMRSESGAQFDPVVADVLLSLLASEERTGRFHRDAAAGPASDAETDSPPSPSAPAGGRSASQRERGPLLAAAMGRVSRLPALRQSQEQLDQLLADPATQDKELLAVIEADLALTVATIRAANALGDPPSPITSVPDALRHLDREQLVAVSGAVGSIDYFQRVAGWEQPLEYLRLHALATQRATSLISRMLDRSDHDMLMSGALLHDIGKLVLEAAYPHYPRGVHGDADTPDARVKAEQRELGVDHALVGGLMLRRWGMPAEIAAMVERHHSLQAEGPAAILRLADMLAHYAHAQPIDPQVMHHAATTVGLEGQQLRALMFDLSRVGEATPRATEPSPLSPSERNVLRGLADGQLYKEIATDLGVSVSTVRTHCHNVYAKFGVADRSQAVLFATSRGWI